MKNVQGKLPILLSLAFVATIFVLAASRLRALEGTPLVIAVALVVLYFVWLVVEAKVAVREIDKGRTALDRGTLELYAFGRAATVVTSLAVDSEGTSSARHAAGLAIFVLAVAFRLAAVRALGRFYSHRVRVASGHRIVDTGPYRFLRHPAYTGMLLAHAGLVVVFFNWLAVAALVLVLLPAIVLRIRAEETALMQIDGYVAYSRTRPRLLPLVW